MSKEGKEMTIIEIVELNEKKGGGVVVSFIIDLKKEYQPYFKAFIKAKGLKDGDTYKSYEYINWINGKHEEYKKSIGLDIYTPYTKEQKERFLEFINISR